MKKSEKRSCRLLPCGAYDVERIESWLTDLASVGWHLDAVASSVRLFRFTLGPARPVRYRLEPKRDYHDQSEKPEEAIREVYEACGWEAVADFGPFFIFRADDPNARELHTDSAMHMEVYKRLLRRYFWCNIFVLLLTAALIGFLGHDWYRRLAIMGPVFTLVHPVVLLPLLCVEIIWEFFRILRLYRQLKRRQSLDHGRPWRKGAWGHKISFVLEKALYLLFVLSLIVPLVKMAGLEKPLEEYPGDAPIVTIADLLPGGQYTPDDTLDFNAYEENATLAARNLSWHEYAAVTGQEGERISGLLGVNYHQTASSWLAMGLAREYWREAQKEQHSSALELPPLEVDFAAACSSVGGQRVVLCKGSTVVYATVSLEAGDMDAFLLWLEKTVQRLNASAES